MERAVILSDGRTIKPADLNFAFERRRTSDDFVHMLDLSGSLSDVAARASRAAEKIKIKQALEIAGWNKTQAAGLLDVSYKTLLNKVKDYKLE
jgi:two-component system response regulator AtoC